tara:strand:- start:383 stop:1045 length:663 start_codon:yes stop_codon:yes gene_type:complete
MTKELKKRVLTSIALLSLLFFMYLYSYILIISIIIIALISWIEFYGLVSKIFFNNSYKEKILLFSCKVISLIYLFLLTGLILYVESEKTDLKIYIIYSLMVSIATDIGGITFGKFFKGKRLTKISPNKTISGSIGSFILSILLIPFFYDYFNHHELFTLIMITVLISLISQIGDLLISLIKRKANVKNTSNLLPGHGGFLDRIDGIILSIPTGYFLFSLY